MHKQKTRKLLSFLLILTLLIPVCQGIMPEYVAEAATLLKNPRTDSDGVTTWDCVWFGNYWQEDTNGDGKADQNDAKTPIKWRMLSVDGDDAFLVADKILDCRKYNDTDTDVTWETCTMRTWLNGYGGDANNDGKSYGRNNFLHNAFSKSERSAIKTINVVNNDNPENNTEGGNSTSDKVYLLSLDEVTNSAYGFSSDYNENDKSRWAKTTEYAKARGAKTYSELSDTYAGNGYWWLRSPGFRSSLASDVMGHGSVSRGGGHVNDSNTAVRPALHLNLKALSDTMSSSSWSYAGTVTSKGKVEEIEVTNPTEPGKPSVPSTVIPGEFTGKLNNPTTDADGIVIWDCVYFGNYWQEDTNGDGKADKNDEKTPIKWRVLSVEGNDVLLLADENLDCQKYNETYTDVTWETCTLRSWLNGYGAEVNQEGKDYSDNNFLDNAFSKSEQLGITITDVVNYDNSTYGTKGGNNTLDKVYLLSINEVMEQTYGFSSDNSADDHGKRGKTTEYAKQQGVKTYSVISDIYAKYGYWWLRSPGRYSYFDSNVDDYGSVSEDGEFVHNSSSAVRPALHLNLSSISNWSYAGTVNSEGKVKETGAANPIKSEKPSTPPTFTPGEITGRLNNPTTDANGIVTWDCVYFGNYWQEDTNGDGKADKNDAKTLIKWRVLSVDGNDAFLLADKNLDCQRYNDTDENVTWETCTMRSWLNGYGAGFNISGKDYSDDNFLDNAFSESEQSAIRTTDIVNNVINANLESDIMYGGNDTSDKVYLLSISEVMNPSYGFTSIMDSTDTREAVNTAYLAAGGEIKSSYMSSAGSTNIWWLRSPAYGSSRASYVDSNGYVFLSGDDVCDDHVAVRPALHLNLSSTSGWSYAGTITSEGGETSATTPTPKPSASAAPSDQPDVSPTATPGEVTGTLKNPTTDADGMVTWDSVYFGNYWQEDTNGDGKADKDDDKTPIKWRVLSVDGDDAFLLADKNLDCQSYNDVCRAVTWETCTMRSWLNGYGAEKNKDGKDYSNNNFLNNAFSETEQAAIKITNVVNSDNSEYGTEGGNDTSDKVYLLSLDEVTNPAYGFSGSSYDLRRAAKTTEYAKAQGVWADDPWDVYIDDGCWWLRSPGENSDDASYVGVGGPIYDYDVCGNNFYGNEYAARPALHLNLRASSDDVSSVVWSYAGTVTVEGEVEEPEETDKPSAPAPTPGIPSQPGISSVTSFVPQQGSAVTPASGILPDSGKNTVGKVTDLKLKQKKYIVTASWKKQTGVKGYQICYSTSKKWKGKKQKLVTKNNAVIKNLKKKKTYYFRVRAYRLQGTKKVYGAWSSVKKIKIKK